HVENGLLNYAEGWPRIENVEADLQFERDSMTIVGRSGSVLGARIANVRVSIPELAAPSAHLLVNGQASGPTADFLKFVASSPLQKTLGGLSDNMHATGNAALR